MFYLEIKSLHIVLVTSWFAGLFYLPRIFVNLAMVPADSTAERDRLLLMAGKLYRFMTPIGYLALLTGLWLWLGVGISGPWLHAKLTLVLLLSGFHGFLAAQTRRFGRDEGLRTSRTWRMLNEIPSLMTILIVVLVIAKPF